MKKNVQLKAWEILKSEYVLNSQFMQIRKDTVKLPDGTTYDDYFVRERLGWAAIFCLTHDNRVILNRQYKHGIGKVVLELPAGSIDEADPKAVDTVARELREETGYEVDSIEYIGKYIIDPTACNAYVYLFFGKGAYKVEKPSQNVKEIIDVELVTIPELIELVRTRKINVHGHVAFIYTVLDKLGYITIKYNRLKKL